MVDIIDKKIKKLDTKNNESCLYENGKAPTSVVPNNSNSLHITLEDGFYELKSGEIHDCSLRPKRNDEFIFMLNVFRSTYKYTSKENVSSKGPEMLEYLRKKI